LKPNTPVCNPSFSLSGGPRKKKIKRIYFAHVRKAGGTTLRAYLARVAEVLNIEFYYREAGKFENPTRSDTLYVSHLREPIARVLSNYKYEYRWDCEEQLLQEDFQPTLENIANNLTKWFKKQHLQSNCRANVWACSTNCNVKMFSHKKGVSKCEAPRKNTTEDEIYRTAIEKIGGYNLVVDVERLFNSDDYGRSIESYFGVEGLVGLKMDEMYCGAEAKKANKLVPLVLENSTLEEIKKRNSIDITFFKQVTTCENNEIRFPTESLEKYIAKKKATDAQNWKSLVVT